MAKKSPTDPRNTNATPRPDASGLAKIRAQERITREDYAASNAEHQRLQLERDAAQELARSAAELARNGRAKDFTAAFQQQSEAMAELRQECADEIAAEESERIDNGEKPRSKADLEHLTARKVSVRLAMDRLGEPRGRAEIHGDDSDVHERRASPPTFKQAAKQAFLDLARQRGLLG